MSDPVQVFAVGDIRLSPPASINCTAAGALLDWSEDGAAEAEADLGSQITALKVAASHACRRRNNRSGGKLSEHAKGNAIDISQITLDDGKVLTVEDHWASRRYGQFMKALHKGACGPFGVVLGPRADRYHQDHFHFDISYLNNPYCR